MKKAILCLLMVVMLSTITGCGNNNNLKTSDGKKINIQSSKTKQIQYEDYSNGLFSMKIPKGWKVDVGTFDYIHYTFMAYNKDNPSYKIFFNMKSEGYLKNEKEREWYANLYPTSPFAKLPAINPQTTEKFYQVFTEAMSPENTENFKFPVINEFKTIEKIGTNITGGEIIRATYKDDKEKIVDGIFTATIKEVSLYYVTALNVYTTMFFTTPENELTEWESILNYCVSTIEFSDKFVSGFNNQEQTLMNIITANQKIYDEMSDVITKGWERRQNTYDIISQKQSDATLGYERVYDTDTKEIYKAYNGFTDDYHGEKYKTITDDMYNLPTSGYIEK